MIGIRVKRKHISFYELLALFLQSYLGRRCPWHYNCNFPDGSVYSNGTDFDYENCQMYQCDCSGEQVRTGGGYVELKPCTGIQSKIGRTCNYVMPTGCAFVLEKCGYGARFYHEHDDSLECKPIVYWCTKT